MRPELSIIPEPDRSTVERKRLTGKQREAMAKAQGGLCGCGCAVKLDHPGEGTIDEHLNPLKLTGTNDRSNRALYRLPCAKEKTRGDIGRIAKAHRQGGETGQQARRERRGHGSIRVGKTNWPKRTIAKRVRKAAASRPAETGEGR